MFLCNHFYKFSALNCLCGLQLNLMSYNRVDYCYTRFQEIFLNTDHRELHSKSETRHTMICLPLSSQLQISLLHSRDC